MTSYGRSWPSVDDNAAIARRWWIVGLFLMALAVLLPSPGAGLIVSGPDMSAITYKHMTADFGPSRFNVSGQLVVTSDPEGLTLCKPSTQRLDGQVVLVRRGGCAFVSKGEFWSCARWIMFLN